MRWARILSLAPGDCTAVQDVRGDGGILAGRFAPCVSCGPWSFGYIDPTGVATPYVNIESGNVSSPIVPRDAR